MVRIGIAALLGGILLQAWGFASWMALGWHDASYHDLGSAETEDALVALIQEADLKDAGWYYWPAMPDDLGDQEAMQAYNQRHASMPTGHLVVAPAGQQPMPPTMWAIGGATNVGIAFLASLLVAMAHMKGFFKRWVFVVGIGVVVVLACDVASWNWMRFPTDHSITMAVDRLIGMVLAGLVIAAIVYPKKSSKHPEPKD
ncbi:MAG: hypothetical protein AAGA25_13860 [Planctomycetota bacterium]